jgi:serine/threonine protein kinase
LNKEITFDNDCCISNDAKKFVLALLRRIPEQRLTAKEALQHDFIQKYHQLSCLERESFVLLFKIHESIQRFLHSTDLRKIILQRIASRYPANEILDLTHLFTNLDTTGEGALYFSDFITILADFSYSDSELKDIFGCIVRTIFDGVHDDGCFSF